MKGVCSDTRGEQVPPQRRPHCRVCLLVWLLFAFGVWCCVPGERYAAIALAQPSFPEEPEFDPEFDTPNTFGRGEPNWEPKEPLVDVRIEGNTTIPAAAISRLVKTRPGRVPSTSQVRDDVNALYKTKWFAVVQPIYRQTEEGPILVFKVREFPILRSVEYVGNKKIKTKNLEALTGLKPGGAFAVSINREAVRRIEEHYREKGYLFAKVELERGGQENDREVVFRIEEGPRVFVYDIDIKGNSYFSTSLLKTKLKTSTRKLWLFGGKYDPATIHDDIASLREYYHSLGFFDVAISHDVKLSEDRAKVYIEYTVNEGVRYKVRNVEIEGENVLSESTLRKDMELTPSQYFSARKMTKDLEKMRDQYGELGRIFARVEAMPRFLEEPGEVDLVYNINEDKVYRIRRIDVVINGDYPHTKESVVLNQLLFAPGDLANQKLIEKSRRRLAGSGYFDNNAMAGTAPKIGLRPVEEPIGGGSGSGVIRAQAFDQELRRNEFVDPWAVAVREALGPSITESLAASSVVTDEFDRDAIPLLPHVAAYAELPPDTQAPSAAPGSAPASLKVADASNSAPARTQTRRVQQPLPQRESVIRAQGFSDAPAASPLFNNDPQGDPFGNALRDPPPIDQLPGFIDVVPEVTETQTGRLMFGVGVNSDAGVVGSVVLDDGNFDILRPPTSFRDILNGTAWRGGGQQFRLEAVPGNEVSRYLISWKDPYFLDTNFSFGVSGFYYTRIFNDWREERAGGRLSVGQQYTPFLSSTLALRLEEVELKDPRVPTPPLLQESLGSNFLSSVRVGLQHDTRDSAFMASEGHFIELAFEQAFGDFVYPRFDIEGRQYFTLYERPDGEGRHILALRGQLTFTGDDTPIFERLYAGGFQSFRGFDFRGVSPRDMNVAVGGEFLALGSAEYMFPITADETLRGVVFTDFGTVEENVTLNNFRLSAGAGLRITIPAMGPMPIALDLAWPIMKQAEDDTRIFSFYVGFTR